MTGPTPPVPSAATNTSSRQPQAGIRQTAPNGRWRFPATSTYASNNRFHILGEVRNPYDLPMELVRVLATCYDPGGHVIAVTYSFSSLAVIPPGEKSPFRITWDSLAGFSRYALQAEGRPGDRDGLALKVPHHATHAEGSWLQVFGEVQNDSPRPVENVRVVVTLYDSQGGVAGVCFTRAQADKIPPGEKAPFQCSTDHFPDFDHYTIQVQGD